MTSVGESGGGAAFMASGSRAAGADAPQLALDAAARHPHALRDPLVGEALRPRAVSVLAGGGPAQDRLGRSVPVPRGNGKRTERPSAVLYATGARRAPRRHPLSGKTPVGFRAPISWKG